MDLLYPQCAGLDVHQHTVVVCARTVAGSAVTHDVRTFGTTTADLLALSDWLTGHGCTHVAMEATGVYWKPVWHVLERSFELVLANPMHVDTVRFVLKLARKDIGLATELAREYDVPMPMAAVAEQILVEALARGWGDKDSTAPWMLQEEAAGVTVRATRCADVSRWRRFTGGGVSG